MHDVPSVSKPMEFVSGAGRSEVVEGLRRNGVSEECLKGIYRYLRLRLELRAGMVVVSFFLSLFISFVSD